MRSVDLTNYALEDLLAFDDIFLDYFNNFLRNLTFPQQVQYNRFLGIFEEIDQSRNSIIEPDRLPKHITIKSSNLSRTSDHSQNLNETEENKIFDWVRQERLPLFFRTDFFREFKLCKLLTRPLEDLRSESRTSSQLVGGYSRQSPPISNTLSTNDHDGRITGAHNFLYGSGSNLNESRESLKNDPSAESTYENINKIDLPFLERFNNALFLRPGSRALSVPCYFPFASINFSTNTNLFKLENKPNKNPDSVKSRKSSFKSNKNLLKRQEVIEDLSKLDTKKEEKRTIGYSLNNNADLMEGDGQQKQFKELNIDSSYEDKEFLLNKIINNNMISAEMNEDMNPFEVFRNPNLNLKLEGNLSFVDDDDDFEAGDENLESEKLHASINQYKQKFLGSHNGMCEFKEFLKNTNGYKLVKFWLDCEFYRDSMQDYDEIENMATRNRLFREINEKYVFAFSKKVHEKISENYLNNSNLNHNLFDEIQYDILRRLRAYWVPRFILNKLKTNGKDYGAYPLPPLTPEYSRQSTYITVPSAGKNVTTHSIKSYRKNAQLSDEQKLVIREKVKQALYADKAAGGPFLRFISASNPDNLPLILFWYDVCDFNEAETMGFDKNSRLQHAWAIYNNYLSPTAKFSIKFPNELCEEARKSLVMQTNLQSNIQTEIDTNIFQPVMEKIVPYLQDSWIQFIKDDINKYTQSRIAMYLLNKKDDPDVEDEREVFENMPEPEADVENGNVYIKRPFLHNYFLANAKENINTNNTEVNGKKSLSEEEKAQRVEKLKQMELERKKALKAALRRARQKRLSILDEERAEELKNEEKEKKLMQKKISSFLSDRGTLFDKMNSTNKSMMQLYRKHFVDNGQRDFLNKFNAYIEAKQYLDTSDQTKKNNIAQNMMKNYLDQNSRKNLLPLNERLQQRLAIDLQSEQRSSARPKTPFLSALVKEYRPLLEEQFQKFCESQSGEHGLSSAEDFALLNQTELLVLLGDNYNPKDFDFEEEKGEGKIMPSKEDRLELLKYLYEWSIGKNMNKFYGFYAHLNEHGRRDGFPFLDKDLMFCIDTIRLKEINGDEVLKQKSQIIVDLYLDSTIPPSTQIDVNHETQQKLYRSALRIIQGMHASNELSVFDDVRSQLFKDILPYWSGYKFATTSKPNEAPITKQEKVLKERLEEFLSMKNPTPINLKLPTISPRLRTLTTPQGRHPLHTYSQHSTVNIVFSIATGVKLRDEKIPYTAHHYHDRKNSHMQNI